MAPEEVRARQMLLDMQERLNRDPYEAFSVGTISDPGEVRAAFLEITKVYHPARFARMTVEIQRLANEVFLSLRASYDTLARPSINKPAVHRPTGSIPVFAPNGRPPSTTTRPQTASLPTVTPPGRAPTQPVPSVARAPTGATPVVPRTATQPTSSARPTGANPVVPRTASQVPPHHATTTRMRPVTRPPDPAKPPVRMPSSSPPPPTVAHPTVPRAGGSSPLAAIEHQLAPVIEQLTQGKFTDARAALETLVARHPGVVRYRALIHYSRGREAQLARRIDEARVELMDALQLDPELQIAKSALSELFTRRK